MNSTESSEKISIYVFLTTESHLLVHHLSEILGGKICQIFNLLQMIDCS